MCTHATPGQGRQAAARVPAGTPAAPAARCSSQRSGHHQGAAAVRLSALKAPEAQRLRVLKSSARCSTRTHAALAAATCVPSTPEAKCTCSLPTKLGSCGQSSGVTQGWVQVGAEPERA